MSNQEQFIQIIKRAEKNGYKEHLDMLPELPTAKASADLLVQKILWQRRYEIIFSHTFAKAHFGEELIYKNLDEEYTNYAWIVHITQMVLTEDPIKYLLNY